MYQQNESETHSLRTSIELRFAKSPMREYIFPRNQVSSQQDSLNDSLRDVTVYNLNSQPKKFQPYKPPNYNQRPGVPRLPVNQIDEYQQYNSPTRTSENDSVSQQGKTIFHFRNQTQRALPPLQINGNSMQQQNSKIIKNPKVVSEAGIASQYQSRLVMNGLKTNKIDKPHYEPLKNILKNQQLQTDRSQYHKYIEFPPQPSTERQASGSLYKKGLSTSRTNLNQLSINKSNSQIHSTERVKPINLSQKYSPRQLTKLEKSNVMVSPYVMGGPQSKQKQFIFKK